MPDLLAPWALEPEGSFRPDPDGCPYCRRDPAYQHRHWRQVQPRPLVREDGPVWRFLFWVYGNGGVGG